MSDLTRTIAFAALMMGGLALVKIEYASPSSSAQVKPSLYDEVLKRGSIRCGYTPYSVGLQKDPNTKIISGIYVDVINSIAKNLELKVEWVEEVGWGQQVEGLKLHRYDMICSPVSLTMTRARAADFSIPLYYSPVHIWGKNGVTQADAQWKTHLNAPTIKIATLDGEQTQTLAKSFFPQAQQIALPQSASFAELLTQVTSGKADYVFAEPFAVFEYMETNPKSFTRVTSDEPMAVVPNIFLLPAQEVAFQRLIDNSLRYLINTGELNLIIDKYETYPGSYVRVKPGDF
ncbi:MAG TPA: transporter substrate-binding domain-containing protein [Alphaproteobacteria bacterium]